MTDAIKDMISATINQDPVAFLDKFETALNTKLAAKLDAMYPEVAHAQMNPSTAGASEEVPAQAQ